MRQSNDDRSVPCDMILSSGVITLSELRRRHIFIVVGERMCMYIDGS
jgi:hypothetical protein